MTSSLLSSLGTELVWQLIGSMFAVVLAVAACLPLTRRAPVAPVRALAGAWLAAALPVGLTRILLVGWDAPGTERLRVTTFAAEFLLGPLTVGPAIALTTTFLLVAGAQGPARAFLRPALLATTGLGLAAALVFLGNHTGNWPIAYLRAVGYLGFCAVIALASLSAGPRDEGGPDAGAAAAALLPVVVGVGEASARGLVWFVASSMTGAVAPEDWSAFVVGIRDVVAFEWTVSWSLLGGSIAASGVAAVRPDALARTAVPWLAGALLGASTLWGSDLAPSRLQVLAPLCSGQAPTSAEEQSPERQEQPDRDDLPSGAEGEGHQP